MKMTGHRTFETFMGYYRDGYSRDNKVIDLLGDRRSLNVHAPGPLSLEPSSFRTLSTIEACAESCVPCQKTAPLSRIWFDLRVSRDFGRQSDSA
ncbi:hypothetical protein [Variovorax paradoxus]|uniref:hypothetical protein n=1 Tax=Variovorax paradoxus TaxID=34073 RepID=UPI003D65A1C5